MPNNFTDNPSDLIKQVFNQIHQDEMCKLPFINQKISVNTLGFALYDGDWLGALVTPWMLNLLLLPGPNKEWQSYKVGKRMKIKFASGDYTFHASEHNLLGQYLSCSLSFPVSQFNSQSEIEQVAKDTRLLVSALPVQEVSNTSRRELFTKHLK